MECWTNFALMLKHVGKKFSNPYALNDYENGEWRSYSTALMLEEIKYIALGLTKLGLKRGECVALMSLPSARWTIVNLAVIMAGGILVPLFPNLSEENLVFEVTQTKVKKIFVERRQPVPIFDRNRKLFETVIDLFPETQDETAIKYGEILEMGKAVALEDPDRYTELEGLVRDDDLAAIIYTSATTGKPKGVELTHKCLTGHLCILPTDIDAYKTRYLSILPLAHIFGYTMNLTIVSCGASLYYANDVKNIGNLCRQVHPTMLVVVPRLLEKVYAKMQAAVQDAGFMKRRLGQWAFDLANQETDSLIGYLVHPLVDKIVYSHLRESLGGCLEEVVSGGAALDPHLNHFFQKIGVPIYEGWGLTEACPVTVNRPGANKIGTVGQPLGPEIKIKISPEGEILVKGTLVMRGYFQNPEVTSKALDGDGWLHTGDKGEIDSDGFLTVHGRIKDLYKTSTGEWVAPIPIEHMICRAPLIETAMVIAEGRKFASCLLFPNKEILDSLKAAHHEEHQSDETFLSSDFVRREMDALFASLNKRLNNWEQIRAYCFVPQALSIESGEMTPSMKIRRDVIEAKYKHLIDAMYLKEKV